MTSPRRPDRGDPQVAAWLERAELPEPGASVTAAVSGGADSTALLALCVAAGLEVTAVHVDHGLRDGSAAEGEWVAALASRWGVAARRLSVTVTWGPNLEERARDARRSVLPSDALFGHTADDQAETLLVRLLRGTGPAGLAQMSPITHPLLGLRRAETAALCAHLGVAPLEDPSNRDLRFVRNRVRAEVLPLLDDVAGRDVVPLLTRLAQQSSAQRELLDGLVDDLDPTDARALAAAPRELAALALRRWWRSVSGHVHGPDAAATERMLEVVDGAARATEVTNGWRLVRSRCRLDLVRVGSPG